MTMKFGELGQHISEKPAVADVILLKTDATDRTLRHGLCARGATHAGNECAIFFKLSETF